MITEAAMLKAGILSQALPYVQKYHHKILLIKYGGNAMLDFPSKNNLIRDIVLLSAIGIKVVLVHGGGPDIDHELALRKKESRFIRGLRYTDAETMEVVQMVLCGRINKELVSLIAGAGARGVGISGMDAGLIEVEPYAGGELGFVGKITRIREKILLDLLDAGYIPVVSGVGIDGRQQPYNINADLAAAAIAAKLQAENMVLISNVPGLLREVDREESLISTVYLSEVERLKAEGIIAGGMIPKVDCCVEAVEKGVKKACIIDGRIPHSLLIEILSDEGIGTMFVKGEL